MAAKMRGGSSAQHAKAGRQSHKNDTRIDTPRAGQARKGRGRK